MVLPRGKLVATLPAVWNVQQETVVNLNSLDKLEANRYGLYFPGWKRPDERFPDASLNWICKRCADDLDIPRFSPRDIRRTWRTLAGDAGLSVEQCARLMNHNFGVAIEAKHYDRGIYADLKRDGMEKWERFVDKMLA